MTKPFIYKGEPLTEERAAQIADETLAELASLTDEDVEAIKREPGTMALRVAARMGRPRLGAGESVQIRARLSPELSAQLKTVEVLSGRPRSEIVRDALTEYLAGYVSAGDRRP